MIKPDRWQPSDGLKLEPNAMVAVREIHRSLALTAGPGAGKTEMLAQRADFLLRTATCRYPQRILAITFKIDASRNLKQRVRQRCGYELGSRLDSHTFHAFAKRIIDRFRPVLQGRDALDPNYTIGKPRVQKRQIEFEDMVPLALKILQTSEMARNAVRQTYSHVFLDEFQDCTDIQYQLIQTTFLGTNISLTAVGDTKQRIMGWAGALEGVFLAFANDFDARALNLYQNFRSQPRLRRMQNAMVRLMDPDAAVPDAKLVGDSGFVDVLEFQHCQEEAEELAGMIHGWINEEGVPVSEIAVLLSRQPDLYAASLMRELAKRGVPFRNEQNLQDLSAEPAARLIVDFLLVVVGEREPEAYGRLMEVVLSRGVDEDAAYELRAGWHRFINEVRARAHKSKLAKINSDALREMGDEFIALLGRDSLAALSADYERGGYLEDVVNRAFDRLEEFTDQGDDATRALARFSEDKAVRIMTIHKSKGLEFDSVIVLGVENETFWGDPEPERSAFFVGISRAKRRLWLTWVHHRTTPAPPPRRWDEERTPHEEFLEYARAVM